MLSQDTSRISPTAHYTGYVWHTRGLAPAELTTRTGKAMHWAMRGPVQAASLLTGGLTLDDMLLQRHLIVDHLLEQAIERGVSQIVEVAGGLSARGHRFARRHPQVTYVEGDLPGMAERKRRLLQRLPRCANHHVVTLNALADRGEDSIFTAVGAELDTARSTAIVTEGLIPYFSIDDAQGMWRRFAAFLGQFPSGLYLSDIHFDDEHTRGVASRGFRALIKTVARGDTHVHYKNEQDMRQAALSCGFASAQAHRPSELAVRLALPTGPDLVHVLEARLG